MYRPAPASSLGEHRREAGAPRLCAAFPPNVIGRARWRRFISDNGGGGGCLPHGSRRLHAADQRERMDDTFSSSSSPAASNAVEASEVNTATAQSLRSSLPPRRSTGTASTGRERDGCSVEAGTPAARFRTPYRCPPSIEGRGKDEKRGATRAVCARRLRRRRRGRRATLHFAPCKRAMGHLARVFCLPRAVRAAVLVLVDPPRPSRHAASDGVVVVRPRMVADNWSGCCVRVGPVGRNGSTGKRMKDATVAALR